MLIAFGIAGIMAVFVYASARDDMDEGYQEFMDHRGFGGFYMRFAANGLARGALAAVMFFFIWDAATNDNENIVRATLDESDGNDEQQQHQTYTWGDILRSKLMTHQPGKRAKQAIKQSRSNALVVS